MTLNFAAGCARDYLYLVPRKQLTRIGRLAYDSFVTTTRSQYQYFVSTGSDRLPDFVMVVLRDLLEGNRAALDDSPPKSSTIILCGGGNND